MSVRDRAGWVVWSIGSLLTLLYGYAVVAAVGNLIGISQAAASLGIGVSVSGWVWLLIGVTLPILVLAIALLVARRRPGWARIALLTTGLCVVSVLQLDIMHLVPPSSFFA